MMQYAITHETETRRVRWVYDDETPRKETKVVEVFELCGLRDGTLVALRGHRGAPSTIPRG